MAGWRTVVVTDIASLSVKNDVLVVKDDVDFTYPIGQIRELVIDSYRGDISLPLIHTLAANDINVVFCDAKHNPDCFLEGLNLHTESAGCIMDQAAWTRQRKDVVWASVVRKKLRMQRELLNMLQLDGVEELVTCEADVEVGDSTNREGLGARIYFKSLFGPDFIRHDEDGSGINSALNYGYSILLSMVNRILVSHGYNTALGIHHCSRVNSSNLSCDIMEPFRPLVDRVVFRNAGRVLDWDYKRELISIMQAECMYAGKHMRIDTAIEAMTLDLMAAMVDVETRIGVVSFG